MKFKIKPVWGRLKGLSIHGDDMEYTFTSQLFTRSYHLHDANSNIVASLTKTFSWRMDFILLANNNSYQLHQKDSGNELVLKESKNMTTSNKGRLSKKTIAIPLKSYNEISGSWHQGWEISFDTHETEHQLAVLVVACLECYWMEP